MKGYVGSKPEGTPYPAFVVDVRRSRGEDVHDNNGKPFGYVYDIQINLISTKYRDIRSQRDLIIDHFDGFSGVLDGFDVYDCRLTGSTLGMSINKNYEAVMFFSLKTK
ncbi:TPA: hypothetical protein NJ626_000245 [Vibrio parahaemolyticus]|nr:hypothetical protein [Vibrio parahaemolyticus]HCM1516417.1 hypothetical protein [Vibrio parahaemolyticus]